VDFAYEIHTAVGNTCSKALVNEKLVPLDTILQPGDVVEIITQKNAKPSRQWLKFVKTSKARSKIRSVLNIEADGSKKEEEERPEANYASMVRVDGKLAPVKLSKCCDPRPQEEILGFYTKDGKITVHKKDCPNISTLKGHKEAHVRWKNVKICESRTMQVLCQDKVGMLADILNVIARDSVNIEKLNTSISKHGRFLLSIKVTVEDQKELEQLMSDIRGVKGVITVMELK
jgi:GTP pyrophosphokinase